ncbi:uncharacterized protein EV154DRAFT_514687, partial [Mucor mucedo]|uniref:uncharacterized protein n=1 Tax=Mucor mucedo TaxID=29922 RepID=UPI0022204136
MRLFTVTTLLLIALFYNVTEARPGTIVQETGSGKMTSNVSGSGSIASSTSETSTTVTDEDGNTTVSEHSITTNCGTCHGKIKKNLHYTVSLTSFLFLSYLHK